MEKEISFNNLPAAISHLIEKVEAIERNISSQNSKDNISPSEEKEKFLTRKETAEFFKISLYTVHDWVKKGIIKPYKAGNRTYFKQAELIEVLNQSNL